MLSRLLRHHGHTSECLGSGEEALARLNREPLPHLVILDHMMPGASGLEVLRVLREEPRTRSLPVVIFSAVQDGGFRRKAISLGASACWLKGSFDFAQLPDAIQAILATAQSHAAPPPIQ